MNTGTVSFRAIFDKIFNNRNFPDKGLNKIQFCLYKLEYCLNTSTLRAVGLIRANMETFKNRIWINVIFIFPLQKFVRFVWTVSKYNLHIEEWISLVVANFNISIYNISSIFHLQVKIFPPILFLSLWASNSKQNNWSKSFRNC